MTSISGIQIYDTRKCRLDYEQRYGAFPLRRYLGAFGMRKLHPGKYRPPRSWAFAADEALAKTPKGGQQFRWEYIGPIHKIQRMETRQYRSQSEKKIPLHTPVGTGGGGGGGRGGARRAGGRDVLVTENASRAKDRASSEPRIKELDDGRDWCRELLGWCAKRGKTHFGRSRRGKGRRDRDSSIKGGSGEEGSRSKVQRKALRRRRKLEKQLRRLRKQIEKRQKDGHLHTCEKKLIKSVNKALRHNKKHKARRHSSSSSSSSESDVSRERRPHRRHQQHFIEGRSPSAVVTTVPVKLTVPEREEGKKAAPSSPAVSLRVPASPMSSPSPASLPPLSPSRSPPSPARTSQIDTKTLRDLESKLREARRDIIQDQSVTYGTLPEDRIRPLPYHFIQSSLRQRLLGEMHARMDRNNEPAYPPDLPEVRLEMPPTQHDYRPQGNSAGRARLLTFESSAKPSSQSTIPQTSQLRTTDDTRGTPQSVPSTNITSPPVTSAATEQSLSKVASPPPAKQAPSETSPLPVKKSPPLEASPLPPKQSPPGASPLPVKVPQSEEKQLREPSSPAATPQAPGDIKAGRFFTTHEPVPTTTHPTSPLGLASEAPPPPTAPPLPPLEHKKTPTLTPPQQQKPSIPPAPARPILPPPPMQQQQQQHLPGGGARRLMPVLPDYKRSSLRTPSSPIMLPEPTKGEPPATEMKSPVPLQEQPSSKSVEPKATSGEGDTTTAGKALPKAPELVLPASSPPKVMTPPPEKSHALPKLIVKRVPPAAVEPPTTLEKPIMERAIMERPIMERPIMERPIMERPIVEDKESTMMSPMWGRSPAMIATASSSRAKEYKRQLSEKFITSDGAVSSDLKRQASLTFLAGTDAEDKIPFKPPSRIDLTTAGGLARHSSTLANPPVSPLHT